MKLKDTAAQIFIVGDLFDFWYEYKKVVPKVM
jgi:UDP-2,3-diacylglucosamine hydrolase